MAGASNMPACASAALTQAEITPTSAGLCVRIVFFATNRNDFPAGFSTPAAQIASTVTLCFGTKIFPHPASNHAAATPASSAPPRETQLRPIGFMRVSFFS